MKKPTPKKHKLNFIIPLQVYPFDLMVSFGETDAELLRTLKRFGLENEDPNLWKLKGIGRTCRFTTNGTLIRLQVFPDSSLDYGSLNHEIFHAVCYIMDTVGMSFEIGVSDEAYAYLIGFITEKIMYQIGVTLRKKK